MDSKPVTNSERSSSASIRPTDISELSSFLDENRGATGFEITYTDDGVERKRLCHNVSHYAVWFDDPEKAPALSCTPVAPDIDPFIVPLEHIELLKVVEPPPELYTADAETPKQEAKGFRKLAEENPEAVPIPPVIALIGREYESVFGNEDVVKALCRVAAVRPEDCKPAIPILRSLLTRETVHTRAEADAITTLRYIGDKDPKAIAPLADELLPYLNAKIISVRRNAIRCFAAITEEYPEDAIGAVTALAAAIENGADGLEYATYTLSLITHEYPEEVRPVNGTLRKAVLDDSLSDTARLNATAALGRIVGEHPGIAVEVVDDIAALLDTDSLKLRNNVIGLLADVALLHTDVVEPYTKEIGPLLTVDDTYTRINASCTLSRVAEDFPDSVDHVTSTFIDLLSDDNPLVRKNACWALGHLCAQEAKLTLEKRARSDDDQDVRTQASWALAQINQ